MFLRALSPACVLVALLGATILCMSVWASSFEPPAAAPTEDAIVIPPKPAPKPPSVQTPAPTSAPSPSSAPQASLDSDRTSLGTEIAVEPPTASPGPAPVNNTSSSISIGGIVGIIIAVVIGIIAAAGVAYYFVIKRPEMRAAMGTSSAHPSNATPFTAGAPTGSASNRHWKEKLALPTFAASASASAAVMKGLFKKKPFGSTRDPGAPFSPRTDLEGGLQANDGNTVFQSGPVPLVATTPAPSPGFLQLHSQKLKSAATMPIAGLPFRRKKGPSPRVLRTAVPAPEHAQTFAGVDQDFYTTLLNVPDENGDEDIHVESSSDSKHKSLGETGFNRSKRSSKPSAVASADDTETETLASDRAGFFIPAVGSASAASRRQSKRLSAVASQARTGALSGLAPDGPSRGRSATIDVPSRKESSLERSVAAAGDRIVAGSEESVADRASASAHPEINPSPAVAAAISSNVSRSGFLPQPKSLPHAQSFDLPSNKMLKRGSGILSKKTAFASFSSRPQSELLRNGNSSSAMPFNSKPDLISAQNRKSSVSSSDDSAKQRRSSGDLPPLEFDPVLNSAARLAALLATTPADAHQNLFRDMPASEKLPLALVVNTATAAAVAAAKSREKLTLPSSNQSREIVGVVSPDSAVRQSIIVGNKHYRQSTALPPTMAMDHATPALEGYDLNEVLTDEADDALWSPGQGSPNRESDLEIASDSSREGGGGKRKSRRVTSAMIDIQDPSRPRDAPRVIQSKFVAVSDSSDESAGEGTAKSKLPSAKPQKAPAKGERPAPKVGLLDSDDGRSTADASDEEFDYQHMRRHRASRIIK